MSVRDIGLHFGGDELGSALDRFLDGVRPAPALLGLGEPTHGREEFPRSRNRVFEHLVRHHGYRSIAIESDHLAGTAVDDYVTGGTGDLNDVLVTGFSHGFGASPANRELLVWMREYNERADERLRFYGFDAPLEITGAPSPREALLTAHAYLAERLPRVPHDAASLDALLGDDGPWTDQGVMWDAAKSIGDTAEARALRLVADDIVALFETEAPALRRSASDTAFFRARAHAIAARGLLRYHAAMASAAPERASTLMGLRDAMMAENLRAIAAAEARRGPCLVFAQNAHLQRTRSSAAWEGSGGELRWWSAGALTATSDLGDRYAFVATDFGDADPDERRRAFGADAVALVDAPR
ncbi:erythromycin esterase family protein [Actinomadura algeriensis]|uniref:Erythromycin esterase-like protein n=1 Tax=Actinomadura algeriensis TaxID=1679523 RepID=A0ABR9JLA9_9ACTN|nr:erythromycin esterase family protein [Actinomadura algeriensis]MBE1531339.1 erythromycin esterase-like protein [Actinomadura algeriensis]